jgi:adenosyl cobinamide kinase/adenosyl cobinamide phosphate guanylyltransferase
MIQEEDKNLQKAMTFAEMRELYKTAPKPDFLYRGIKTGSFGMIFGPAKSGKSIFCENLAMHFAAGRKDYLGSELSGSPKKTLFISLEEYWTERLNRNLNQIKSYTDDEQGLLHENYLYQSISFPSHITNNDQWNDIGELIKSSKAELVIIDSVTRLNTGKLEDGANAQTITKTLRDITHETGVTLICIHHTHKLRNQALTLDCMKGSSTFAQEVDFAIGIARTSKGHRYFKDIAYRYAQDDDLTAHEFEISSDCYINKIGECDEDDILARTDGRTTNSKQKVLDHFKCMPNKQIPLKELAATIEKEHGLGVRSTKKYAMDLHREGQLNNEKGVYSLKR